MEILSSRLPVRRYASRNRWHITRAANIDRLLKVSTFFAARDRVGFEIAQYERTKALVIDPQLVYSIYGQGYPHVDAIYGVAVDSIGNAYICGTTFDGFNDNMEDAYVEKINPTGTAVLWQASFGAGGTTDIARAIAVDASGNAY